MIITESQLEQIVREELDSLQQEVGIRLPSMNMPTYLGTNKSNRNRPYPRRRGLSDQEPIKAKKTLAQRLGLGKDWEKEADKVRQELPTAQTVPSRDPESMTSGAGFDPTNSGRASFNGPEAMSSGPGFNPSNPGGASFDDGPEFQGSKTGHGDAILGRGPETPSKTKNSLGSLGGRPESGGVFGADQFGQDQRKKKFQATLQKQLRRNVNRATTKQDPTKMISDIVRNVLRVMGELDVQLEEGELYEAIRHELNSII